MFSAVGLRGDLNHFHLKAGHPGIRNVHRESDEVLVLVFSNEWAGERAVKVGFHQGDKGNETEVSWPEDAGKKCGWVVRWGAG